MEKRLTRKTVAHSRERGNPGRNVENDPFSVWPWIPAFTKMKRNSWSGPSAQPLQALQHGRLHRPRAVPDHLFPVVGVVGA